MKAIWLGAVVVALVAVSTPASAQFGGLMDKAQKGMDAKKKLDSLHIGEEDERKIGSDVSAKVRTRFGVVQDAAVTKYVTLLGMTMASQTERPNLKWEFIVLDTDGVNAFASPGGFVHITRGALGLIKNEAELAGVLGHEIGHVVRKHTITSIEKSNAAHLGTEAASQAAGGGLAASALQQLANAAYDQIIDGKFTRDEELDADKFGVAITQKVGYSSGALGEFLTRLDDRNKNQPERNGLFASHPDTKERIEKIKQMAGSKPGAMGAARYTANVKYEAPPLTAIATVADGSSGLMGSGAPAKDDKAKKDDTKKDDAKKDDPPAKKGFGLGSLTKSTTASNQTAQVSASGGARGVGPDRAAKGGPNPQVVKVTVTAAEVAEFKKGIA